MKKFFETGLLEAGSYDEEKGELTLTVIQPGFNSSKSRYYPEDMLKRDCKVFEGSKMFANHPTQAEEKARPEGSVKDWVGQVKNVWAETDGKVRATCAVIDESFRSKLKNLNVHGLLGQMGVSIRASGEAREAEVQGVKTNIIERLVRGRSVDFVTFPGAGGRVDAMESEQPEEDTEMEEKLKELTAKLALIEAENEQLKLRIEESERTARKAEAKVELDRLLSGSKLPEVARARMQKRFDGAEASTGIQDAIAEEEVYLAEIETKIKEAVTPAPKAKATVKNLGESTGIIKPGAGEKMAAIYQTLGLTETQAKAAVR